jgi:nitrous oxidase accessory protein NosD
MVLSAGPVWAGSNATKTGSDQPILDAEPGTCGSLQGLIDATPSDSVLTVPPCEYHEAVVIDRPMTVRGYGATISGTDESGDTVRETWITVAASDVTVLGFTMRDAANAPQTGAVHVEPGVSRFLLKDCDLARAAGANVSIGVANESRVESCDIHHAGQLGVQVGGDGINGHGNVVSDNTIRGNNTAGFDPEWEAGGLKATLQTDLRLERNIVRNNAGPGLWCDIYCEDAVIIDNAVHDNTHAGIMFEVGTGAMIAGNRVWENGWGKPGWAWGAGILISSSGGVRVIDNTVAWNRAGISVVSQDRQDWEHSADDIEIADNTVVGEAGHYLVAWHQDWDGILFQRDSGNRGSGDEYWSGGGRNSRVFDWRDQPMSHAEFVQTRVGRGSSLLDEAEMRSNLSAAGIPASP